MSFGAISWRIFLKGFGCSNDSNDAGVSDGDDNKGEKERSKN